MPRIFGLMPARFTYRLGYLVRKSLLQRVWDGITSNTTRFIDFLRSAITR
jgi:hypothetical protein